MVSAVNVWIENALAAWPPFWLLQAWGKVRPFLRSHKINYPILMGDRSIPQTYRLEAYPDTFLLDKSGRIAAVYVGVVSKDNVAAKIQTLLAEPLPAKR